MLVDSEIQFAYSWTKVERRTFIMQTVFPLSRVTDQFYTHNI